MDLVMVQLLCKLLWRMTWDQYDQYEMHKYSLIACVSQQSILAKAAHRTSKVRESTVSTVGFVAHIHMHDS